MDRETKIKEDKSLIWIPTPKTKSDAIQAAEKAYHMYEADFSLTQNDIAKRLDCTTKWIWDHLSGEVKHIFLNRYFRKFMKEQYRYCSDFPNLTKFYYYSKTDFDRWLRENIEVTQTTRLLSAKEVLSRDLSISEIPAFKERAIHEQKVPLLDLPKKFYSMKTVCKRRGRDSQEMGYRDLFQLAAKKYIIKNSLVRYDAIESEREIDPEEILVWIDN